MSSCFRYCSSVAFSIVAVNVVVVVFVFVVVVVFVFVVD